MSQTFTRNLRKFQRQLLDEIVRKNPSIGLDKRAEYFTQLFENQLDSESRILDIGGGWGFYREPLEQRGHSHTVLEVIKPGYQRAPVVIYDPAKPFPFEDKSFDVSMFVTVLHHIPDPVAVIREALRVTRKTLIVIEDLYHHPAGRLWTILRDQIYNMEFFGHPCQFKKKEEWIRTFESLGCSVAHQQSVYTWVSGLRILNGIFILRVS